MTLSQSTLSIVALAAAAVALIALFVAAGQGRRVRQLRRLVGARPRASIATPPEEVARELADVRDVLATAIQRVGLVRFDAFEDMGGKLSFAVALLDAEGNGVVFSSINGRTETRIYAKPIERGASRIPLSDEEAEAIDRALGGMVRV